MVKNTGVTIVALATLLAGFVASCASSELPPIADAPPSAATEQAESDDESSGLSSSTGDKSRPTTTSGPTATPTPAQDPVSPTVVAEVDPTATPVPAVVTAVSFIELQPTPDRHASSPPQERTVAQRVCISRPTMTGSRFTTGSTDRAQLHKTGRSTKARSTYLKTRG